MKKLIIGSILGLLCALPNTGMSLGTDDDNTASEAAIARYAELEKEAKQVYKDWSAELNQKLAEAKERGEELADSEITDPYATIVPKFSAAAADYAGTEDAVDFLVWIAENGMRSYEEAGKAAWVTLIETHTKSKGLKPLARLVANLPTIFGEEYGAELLGTLELESSIPVLRGWAGLARLSSTLENADLTSDEFSAAKEEALAISELIGDRGLTFEVESKINLREKFGMGMVAPDIEGVDLDGTPFKLSDYQGKVIFLDFWGDW